MAWRCRMGKDQCSTTVRSHSVSWCTTKMNVVGVTMRPTGAISLIVLWGEDQVDSLYTSDSAGADVLVVICNSISRYCKRMVNLLRKREQGNLKPSSNDLSSSWSGRSDQLSKVSSSKLVHMAVIQNARICTGGSRRHGAVFWIQNWRCRPCDKCISCWLERWHRVSWNFWFVPGTKQGSSQDQVLNIGLVF